MGLFQSILVNVDCTVDAHPALERALRLARAAGARLTIVDVLSVPPEMRRHLPAGAEAELSAELQARLETLASTVQDLPVRAKLLTGRPATVLVQEVLRAEHDLLMRSHALGEDADGRRPFGAVDMELLRRCPCPVYLARAVRSAQRPQVVGAVHASTDDAMEQALNRRIAELTVEMASVEDGVATLLQAWTPFAETMIRGHASEDAFNAYVEDVRRRSSDDLERLADTLGPRGGDLTTLSKRGRPEDVIAAVAESQGVDLVVMGTAARTGLAGWLIGNTAERVLRRLPCSVLAIKPEGFLSQVSLDEE